MNRQRIQLASSSRKAIGILALSLAALASNPLFAATIRCPPMLPSAHPGFEQIGPVPAWHWQLMRLQLFEAPATEASKTAPTERLPNESVERSDGYTLNWEFSGNEDLLMVCIYNGSATYYVAPLRPAPKICTMRNDNGLTQVWCE